MIGVPEARKIGAGEKIHLSLGMVQAEDHGVLFFLHRDQSPLGKDFNSQVRPQEALRPAGAGGKGAEIGQCLHLRLALAEMVASLSKPTVSLIIGDSHSIGVPLAVSADDSFIVPTATMLIHPVRMTGMTIGAPQTYHYFQRIFF